MNALARHLADAVAETAEEHLPKLDQTAYFHVKKALQTAAEHVADAIKYDMAEHDKTPEGYCSVGECEHENDFRNEFIEACCIGRHK